MLKLNLPTETRLPELVHAPGTPIASVTTTPPGQRSVEGPLAPESIAILGALGTMVMAAMVIGRKFTRKK